MQARSTDRITASGNGDPHTLKLELAATLNAPRIARRAVSELAERAGASANELDAVKTIVSEVVTNCVRHAYDNGPGQIHLDAGIVGRELTILVADDGQGTGVPSRDPGLGRGWMIVSQLADDWAVTPRGDGGTLVAVRLRLRPAPR